MSRSGAGPSAILSPAYAFDLVNARSSGVPPSMIDRATACREAGDWRGACRETGFDVQIRPDDVSRRYGTQVRRQLLDDLAYFAPDLLRWHLPRQLRDGGRLQSGLVIPLAEYPGDGPIGMDGGLLLTAIIPARRLQPGPARRPDRSAGDGKSPSSLVTGPVTGLVNG